MKNGHPCHGPVTLSIQLIVRASSLFRLCNIPPARRITIVAEKRASRSRPSSSVCLPSNRPSVPPRLPLFFLHSPSLPPSQPDLRQRRCQAGMPLVDRFSVFSSRPVAATPVTACATNPLLFYGFPSLQHPGMRRHRKEDLSKHDHLNQLQQAQGT